MTCYARQPNIIESNFTKLRKDIQLQWGISILLTFVRPNHQVQPDSILVAVKHTQARLALLYTS